MCQILNGKRKLTEKSAKRISEGLMLSPEQTSRLESSQLSPPTIDMETFRLISDWYHYAILSLSELPKHRANPKYVSEQLGISERQASDALKRLVKLGILEIRHGKMRQISAPIKTGHDVPSVALRAHHRQLLTKAQDALEQVSVDMREFGSMTLATAPSKIPIAKRLIRKFREELAAVCETSDPELVYHLCIQFFPTNLTKESVRGS